MVPEFFVEAECVLHFSSSFESIRMALGDRFSVGWQLSYLNREFEHVEMSLQCLELTSHCAL
jgi:hypothetical protein